jgi:group I intron endonuclease
MFYIYLIFNKENGKIYVGKTNNPKYRLRTHLKIAKGGREKYPRMFSVIHAAINKYGKENFVFKLIEKTITESEILIKESQWIKSLKDSGYILYNLTDGGDGVSGWHHTEKTKRNMSLNKSGANNPMFGTHRPESVKKDISNFRKENFNYYSNLNRGSKNPNAKLTENKVIAIKKLISEGLKDIEIANLFSVSKKLINDIRNTMNMLWFRWLLRYHMVWNRLISIALLAIGDILLIVNTMTTFTEASLTHYSPANPKKVTSPKPSSNSFSGLRANSCLNTKHCSFKVPTSLIFILS